MHRGYTSETGGHASCPFDFYKTWVNAPDKAKAVSEALTRDADAVEEASNVTQVPISVPAFHSLLGSCARHMLQFAWLCRPTCQMPARDETDMI